MVLLLGGLYKCSGPIMYNTFVASSIKNMLIECVYILWVHVYIVSIYC